MRPKALIVSVVSLLMVLSVSAHDLFLKLDSYFLPPNATATVRLLNGTFQSSEGTVSRDRMRDVTVLTPAGHTSLLAANSWRDNDKMTTLELQTSGPGTYVVGISTKTREIDLKAAEFNDYLAHDGIPDVLAARRKSRELNKNVRERYSKHVRAVFQVGDARSEQFRTPLNYPVEIIPQRNPYLLKVGQVLPVLCTLEGKPLRNQFVMAGWEGRDGKLQSISARTDREGIARFRLRKAGKWYVKMIHMTPIKEPGINYESKWATLTFEIK